MPIDEKIITPEVLNNTLKQEVYPEIKVLNPPKMGKVRTVYDIGDNKMIMISSDNLSTHDVVHKRQVYGKGENLDAISSNYFEKTKNIIGNHFLENLAPNAWLLQKANPILVEMVFRGYLTGSGWKAYDEAAGPVIGMEFCGVDLRPDYKKNEKLDDIIFTPTAKGRVMDFNIPEFRDIVDKANSLKDKYDALVGDDPKLSIDIIKRNYKEFGLRKQEDLNFVIDAASKLYNFIHADLESKGYLLADTKWEFGYLADGSIGLIDECVTPDSSRFWNKEKYKLDSGKNEFTIVQDDKQHFRDYIEKLGLHKNKKALAEHWMDDEVLKEGVIKYCNISETITGTLPEITTAPRKEIILETLAKGGYLK